MSWQNYGYKEITSEMFCHLTYCVVRQWSSLKGARLKKLNCNEIFLEYFARRNITVEMMLADLHKSDKINESYILNIIMYI